MEQSNLFGLPDTPVKRDHEGKFSYKCDGKPQDNVKRHLQAGLGITVQQCLRMYHSTELRRIISRLRNRGMNIGGEWFGEREYFIYKLVKDVKK